MARNIRTRKAIIKGERLALGCQFHEDAVKAGGFLAGQPEGIIEALKAVDKRYPGLDRVNCAIPPGTPLDVQLEDLDRFAKEVIPAFRDTRTAAAAQ